MKMIGHKTEAICRRYAIQDEVMLREASAKLETWTSAQATKSKTERQGQLRQLRRAK